ncbi:hypothetical protein [Rhizobium lusitanum]|uniref:hypothetical protein n=1 Tax=Rhizobium lusitanum TaxID=293958 RepID=UPI0032B1D61F
MTLFDVYIALARPTLFAIGMRSENPDCQVERNVNEAIKDTMLQAEALFVERFRSLTLDKLSPISDILSG